MSSKHKPSTKINLIYNMSYQVIVLILPLITTPYISRVIGAIGVGTYSYYDSIAQYFVNFAKLGILNYGNRTIARVRGTGESIDDSFSEIYGLQLITSVVSNIIYLLFCLFIADEKGAALLVAFYVSSAILDVSWLFYGLEEFKVTSVRQIIIRIISVLLIFFAVHNRNDLHIYILIMSGGIFVSQLILWIMAWNRVHWRRMSLQAILRHLKPCLVLFIPIIATNVYREMDKIMIGYLCDMTKLGYYENAQKLITISLGVVASFSAVIMPKISNLRGQNNMKEVKRMFDLSMTFAMAVGMAIGFGIASVSNEFVPIFFGDEFIPSIVLSKYLSITVPFISWACIVRTLYLIPFERDRVYVQSIIIGAILNVICNSIFIPRLGVMGAVPGTLIAEISVAVYQSFMCRKELRIGTYLKECVVFFIAGVLMYLAVRITALIVTANVFGLILEILIGAVLYCTIVGLYLIAVKKMPIKQMLSKE